MNSKNKSYHFFPRPLFVVVCTLAVCLAFLTSSATTLVFAEDNEDVEEVLDVEEVEVAPSSQERTNSALPDSILSTLIHSLHRPLVHFPIAWLILLFFVDVATFGFHRKWEKAGYYLGWAALVAFVPAILSGWLRSQQMPVSGETLEMLLEHRNLALVTMVTLSALVAWRRLHKNHMNAKQQAIYMILLLIAVSLVLETGHHGGKLLG